MDMAEGSTTTEVTEITELVRLQQMKMQLFVSVYNGLETTPSHGLAYSCLCVGGSPSSPEDGWLGR